MVTEQTIATLAAMMVTASFPFYLYGAWIMIDAEVVSWGVLIHHLKFIIPGLLLNTIPVVTWMIPRLLDQFGGAVALHAILGLQAYALLAFGLTGIVRIFQVKRKADYYDNPVEDIDLNELHENMSAWRGRLRVGVFGYVILWLIAWLMGGYLYIAKYVTG